MKPGFAVLTGADANPVFAPWAEAEGERECHSARDTPIAPEEFQETQTLPDQTTARRARSSRPKPTCESCYFGIRMLCALELGGPCSTFRPDSPHGLIPPSQPMLLIGPDTVTMTPELAAA